MFHLPPAQLECRTFTIKNIANLWLFPKSSLKHLKLFRISVDREFEVEIPNCLGSNVWPLRTLYLEVLGNMHEGGQEVNTYPLIASILRHCASTLESLHLEMSHRGQRKTSCVGMFYGSQVWYHRN